LLAKSRDARLRDRKSEIAMSKRLHHGSILLLITITLSAVDGCESKRAVGGTVLLSVRTGLTVLSS
jgi:hypothetical protein